MCAIATKVPKGFLDFDGADYAELDIETQRAVYAKVREVAVYTMGTVAFENAVRADKPESPVEWIVAAKSVECDCERCKASGIYEWGASINGKMTHSAECARCAGKGRMDFDDMRRGKAYDNHAIRRACGF
jgi:hypothetical protein